MNKITLPTRAHSWFLFVALAALLVGACSRGDEQPASPTAAELIPTPFVVSTPTVAALPTPPPFTRQALLHNLAHAVVIPAYQTFLERAQALEVAAHAFEQTPTVETLAALQQSWGAAAIAWKECELFDFRETFILHNQVYKIPTNSAFIEQFIAQEAGIDAAFIEGIGSTAKGLPAIEYLIFDPGVDMETLVATFTSHPRSQQRRQYLVAAIENVRAKAQELRALWSEPEGTQLKQFIETDVANDGIHNPLNRFVNNMVALLEGTYKYKIGQPLGYFSNRGVPEFVEPDPTLVESWRSGYSTALLISSLQGLATLYRGADGIGYDDYLDTFDTNAGEPLSAVINQQIETTLAVLESIDAPLEEAVLNNPAVVDQAYKEVRRLMILVRVDMADRLGITIFFSDADGD